MMCKEKVGGVMYEPPAGVVGSSGKESEDGCARWLGFRQGGFTG